MKCGIIGLGRMGLAIAERAANAGHQVYAFDADQNACAIAQAQGITIVPSVASLPEHVSVIWLMVPAGKVVDLVLDELSPTLKSEQIIVDGGNSNFNDSIARAERLKSRNIGYLDCGTSGGLKGREIGFSLMVGGDQKSFEIVEPLFKAIAAPQSYGLVGPSGAGHYVKMIHNGIEYALLQGYAEGFQLLKEGHYPKLDLAQITGIWQHASVIRSWILDLAHDIFKADQTLESISGKVAESGTGRWTVEEAHKQKVPVTLIEQSLKIRDESQKTGGNYATKVVALLRKAFGGHKIETKDR